MRRNGRRAKWTEAEMVTAAEATGRKVAADGGGGGRDGGRSDEWRWRTATAAMGRKLAADGDGDGDNGRQTNGGC